MTRLVTYLALLLCCLALPSTSGSATDGAGYSAEVHPKSMNLTEFWWSSNHLRVCADRTLVSASATKSLLVTIIISQGDAEWNFEGALDTDVDNCAKFQFAKNPLSAIKQSYALVIQRDSTAMRGYAIFAAPVDRAISITCGGDSSTGATHLTRLSGADDFDLSAIVANCLPFQSDDSAVCYTASATAGDGDSICYGAQNSVPENLSICLDLDKSKQDTSASVAYLQYSDASNADGDVALELSVPTTEVLVLRDASNVSCYACTDRHCPLVGLGPSTSVYSVCGVAVGDGDGTTTGSDTIKDLKVKLYRDSVGLEFRFTNAQPGNYSASLSADPTSEGSVAATMLVCSDVDKDGQCYGFLHSPATAVAGTKYFALQYDVNGSDPIKVNKIVVPYTTE